MHCVYLVLFVVLAVAIRASDVAFCKPYAVSTPGFTDLLFTNHNAADYYYEPVYNSDWDGILTRNLGTFDAPHPGLMWYNHTHDFNVTVVLDIEQATTPTALKLFGSCCNMGLYTPTAVYLHGAASDQGPWEWIGHVVGLTSGDQIETPAVRYQLHLHVTTDLAFRFFKVDVTGAADRYISLTTIQLYD